MSRTVVLYELMSLDGVAEDPGQWFGGVDERFMDNLSTVISSQETVLLGRRTYEEWAAEWPTSAMQPFADFINSTEKLLFSSTPPDRAWSATTHVNSSAVEFVADLKRQDGGDIGIHGSLTLARSLLQARLVDELQLVVAPNVAGVGRRLFDDVEAPQHLALVNVQRSGDCLLVSYRNRDAQT
ncbi:dihydrofolate reductase family protein [Nakamurella aerolata]|uniref:Dihydrofolate reductase n=1 Tax=Nakamurella aerolata TaxID=1656892 RepID=A0A849AAU8_9ACTN|nr:dihydrofolate reductase family protein [Nakamurella aerolata]NNG36706.1 dihydrofolate reductase [Nakamurella aerolata]